MLVRYHVTGRDSKGRGFLYHHCVMLQGYYRVEPGPPELLGPR